MIWDKIANSLPGRDANECCRYWTEVLDPSIEKGQWTLEEEEKLAELHENFGDSWAEISKHMVGRSPNRCNNYWIWSTGAAARKHDALEADLDVMQTAVDKRSMPENASESAKWTQAEDEDMSRLVLDAGSTVDWAQLANFMPGRCEGDCRECWIACLNPSSKNSLTIEDPQPEQNQACSWMSDDDEALKRLYATHGNSWGLIAQHMSGRSHLQCRHRWLNVIDGPLSKGPWTNDEDAVLVRLYAMYGKQWSVIAEDIPGRSELQCRSRLLAVVDNETWSSAEDALLRSLLSAHTPEWDKITGDIPNRTRRECQYRGLVLLGVPSHKLARPGNHSPPDSPARKRARVAERANSSTNGSVAGTPAISTANGNGGHLAGESRGEGVRASSDAGRR